MFSEKELKEHVNEWLLEFKEKEEDKKIHPAWKRLRPNKDSLNYRVPGSIIK